MDLTVVKGGKFNFVIGAGQLAKGLRPTNNKPRNSGYLLTCVGASGKDGVLQSVEAMTRMTTSVITDGFPFPQLFVLPGMIIVCGLKKIYEWSGSSLDLKYTATTAYGTWSVIAYYDYVYMSNGNIALVRDPNTKAYTVSSTLPHATAMCDYNGQVLVGAPDVDGLPANLVMGASPFELILSQQGTMTTT